MAPIVGFCLLREVEAPAETVLVPLKRGTWRKHQDRFELTGNKAKKTSVSDVLGPSIEDGRGTRSVFVSLSLGRQNRLH